jgi:hypothetical protein
VEVVVVDGTRGFGNGLLLPAGPLREPRTRLAGVDAVVVNGGAGREVPGATHGMTLVPEAFVNLADPGGAVPPMHFAGHVAHAIAGIADPERFFTTLRTLGVDVVPHAFPDHHRFTAADLARLDAYEDYDPARPEASLYIREPLSVTGSDGMTVTAETYRFARPLPEGSLPIPDGDFRAWLAEAGVAAFAGRRSDS